MESVRGYRMKGERERCRHQIEGVRGVKMGVDVARADWSCVREGTPLREECPSHPNTTYFIPNQTHLRHNKYVIY
ncbi:hypothetical protein Hanom_Chr01g00048521 [Helianthus anomalus]